MKKILMTMTLAFAAAIALPTSLDAQNTTGSKSKNKQCQTECTKAGECQTECTKAGECQTECTKAGECQTECAKAGECQTKCTKANEGKKCFGKAHKGKKDLRHGKKHDKRMKTGVRSERKRHNGGNLLLNGITLTDEQQAKYQALQEKQRTERMAARAEMKKEKAGKDSQRLAQRQKRAEAYDKEMQKILTSDQYKQYQANKENMDKNKRATH